MDVGRLGSSILVTVHRSPLTPVFAGLQMGMHALFAVLTAVVLIRALVAGEHAGLVACLVVAFGSVYVFGVVRRLAGPVVWVWLAVLTALWFVLVAVAADAAYIAFALFFLYVHLLPKPWNLLAVSVATGVAVVGSGAHRGFSAAGVVGPIIGALVAVAIGVGYQALHNEAVERQRLIEELVSTRDVVAAQGRTAGKLAERERLAQEIHDTVAQGLSSIQMLLHVVERATPDHPARHQLRLARQTAADGLAETRRLIAGLSPAALNGQSLSDALDRICAQACTDRLAAASVVEGEPVELPMQVQAALVRIVQGAVSNVLHHAEATRVAVTLTYGDDSVHLDVVDNGIGFDRSAPASRTSTSFGLTSMRKRVERLNGTLDLESEPGHTAVAVSLPFGSEGAPG